MNPLYNTGIRLYSLGVKAAALRSRKPQLMVEGHKEVFARLADFRSRIGNRRVLWVHAASLGEFEQGRPLIERVRRMSPDVAILLTFFSPSGYEVRKNYKEADCVCYLPFDTPGNARKFIATARPDFAAFIKYEFWGNYLSELKRNNIPTILISAIFRPSQSFFKPWGAMFRNMLRCYTHLFVQDEPSRELLSGIGVTNVTVAGDTRFDRVTDTMAAATCIPSIENWLAANSGKPCVVIGSSWEQDEEVYLPLMESHSESLAIIAPHEFNDARLEKLRSRLGKERTMLFSEVKAAGDVVPEGITRIIIDCYGLLSSIYRYASLAYIGGGFGAGIHNLTEAAVYGVPVVFGPRFGKFREARELIACGGGFTVNSTAGLKQLVDSFIADKSRLEKAGNAAGRYIADSIGATDKILDTLKTEYGIGSNRR